MCILEPQVLPQVSPKVSPKVAPKVAILKTQPAQTTSKIKISSWLERQIGELYHSGSVPRISVSLYRNIYKIFCSFTWFQCNINPFSRITIKKGYYSFIIRLKYTKLCGIGPNCPPGSAEQLRPGFSRDRLSQAWSCSTILIHHVKCALRVHYMRGISTARMAFSLFIPS